MSTEEFVVHDGLGPGLTLRGRRLAYTSGDDRTEKYRWTDIAIYEVIDRSSHWKYAIQVIAKSYVYHRVDSPCVSERHRIATIKHIRSSDHRWKNLYPCWKRDCVPPDLEHMTDDAQVAEEREEPSLYLCTNPADILTKLYRRNGEISGLAKDALRHAARVDRRIATAWKKHRSV